MNAVELIMKKRDGKKLSKQEMKDFIHSYLENKIPEYQMAAFLMAIFQRGMETDEVQTLTEIYIESGRKISFPKSWNTVDKHSTGGVGDKISIMLAPIAAACGVKVPMISGRGLGHTGGTLDKLESIPGFRTDLTEKKFKEIIEKVGFSIISQSQDIVPADKRIYALRDVTATVESLPLITASIMSKKIAEGAQNLVIDLKVGSGAFIKNLENAEKLAELLIQTGKKFDQQVAVVFSNMNSPLGNYVGNALEIKECIEYLRGKKIPDIDELTQTLAKYMILLSQKGKTKNEAAEMIRKVIRSGEALEKMREFIRLQKGDPRVCDDPDILPQAKFELPIIAENSGWIESIDAQNIGYALVEINAGRKTIKSRLDHSAGAYLRKKIGDKVEKSEEIGTVFCNDKIAGEHTLKRILASYNISEKKIKKEKMILKSIM